MNRRLIAALALTACTGDPDTDSHETAVTATAAGWINSSFQVGDNGTAHASIPLEAPLGRAGIEPQLALAYSSGAGNGLVGVGWSLQGLSSIARCPRSYARDGEVRAVDFTSGDRFCLDGALLVAVNGANGGEGTAYRTERDTFADVTSSGVDAAGPTRFVVRSRDGRILTYDT